VLESEKIQKEKDLAEAAKTQRSLGAPDCPVVPTVGHANGRPHNPRVTRGQANGLMGAPDSVRCAYGSETSMVGCANLGRRSAPDSEQGMSGGAPGCPVRHSTEGKYCLPRMPPTAPSCLGAIKGTPRRMEE
jgi:hypothetical protein